MTHNVVIDGICKQMVMRCEELNKNEEKGATIAEPVHVSKFSPSEPFPQRGSERRLFVSRLRGRAVRTSVP